MYNPGLVNAWYIVTGVFGTLIILNGSLVAAATMIREKERGTVEQLLMTPASALEVVTAKLVPLFILLMAMVGMVLVMAAAGVPGCRSGATACWCSPPCACCVLTGIGLGTFVSTLARSANQTQLISFFINPPLAMLSGGLTPIEAMPKWVQPLTLFNPIAHFAKIARNVLLKGPASTSSTRTCSPCSRWRPSSWPSAPGGFRSQLRLSRGTSGAALRRHGALPVSSRICPARRMETLNVPPGGRVFMLSRIFAMFAEAAEIPLTDMMMSPPSGTSCPAIEAIMVLPRRPIWSPGESLATVFTMKPLARLGRFKISATRSLSTTPSSPDQNDFFSQQELLGRVQRDHEAQPLAAPPLEMLWLTMPTTSPFMANMGPPELPVLIVASVWKNSASGIVL